MAGIPSRMNQSAREEWLSSDANRIGNLTGREKMDQLKLRSVRADFYAPATNAFDDFTAAGKAAQSAPLAGLTKPPSLEGITAVFDMNIGAGEGAMPGTSSSADISDYQILRWDAQRLTWPVGGTPDATNPLICLIYAIPADVPSDLQSRNILVDTLTRATVPANVYKTSNPVATLGVLAGVAGAVPVPPAVPAGALALLEVWVPALAADSTAFLPLRRAWRQIEFPGTSQHGIVKGCDLAWDPGMGADNGMKAGVHRIAIDGELLTFSLALSIPLVSDTLNPIGNAPAGNDAPSYIYVCGGRLAPVRSMLLGTILYPIALVESLTAPDALGYPSADLRIAAPAMTFPRGACCYVGVRMRSAGGVTSVPAFCEGDWIYSMKTVATADLKGFLMLPQAATNAYAPYTFAGQPAPSSAVDLSVYYYTTPADQGFFSTTATSAGNFAKFLFTNSYGYSVGHKLGIVANPFVIYIMSTGGNGNMIVVPAGYNMNVPRLAR